MDWWGSRPFAAVVPEDHRTRPHDQARPLFIEVRTDVIEEVADAQRLLQAWQALE